MNAASCPWNRDPPMAPRALHDETLRDGIQAASAVDPPIGKKRQIVRLLDQAGVSSCCLALPASGARAERDALDLIAMIRREGLAIRPVLAGRTCEHDVDVIARIAAAADHPVEATLFLGASPIRVWVEGWTDDLLEHRVRTSIQRARAAGLSPSLVLEDSTRTPPETLKRLYGAALEQGANRLVLCDTVGTATPQGAAALVGWTRAWMGDSVGLDWHGHDDRGLALACAIAAAEAGCDRIHGCLGGVGERVGNTHLEHLAEELGRRGAGRWRTDRLRSAHELLVPPRASLFSAAS